MNKGIAILVASALFASGLAVGALGVHLFYSQKIVRTSGPPMPVGPVFERLLFHQLDLSEEQRHRAREILGASRIEAESIRREMGPRLQEMNRRTTDAIGEILTSEQREKLQELMASQEHRRRRFQRGERPPRRPLRSRP